MRPVRVRPTAQLEVAEAFHWYLQRSAVAAQRFLDAVDEAIGAIEEAPERYPVIHGRLRRVLLRRFPYAVYFRVFPSVISVVGVIHGSRHPDSWLRRRP